MWADELLGFFLWKSPVGEIPGSQTNPTGFPEILQDFPYQTRVTTPFGDDESHLDHLQELVILVTMGTHNLHFSWLLGSKGYIPKDSMYGMRTFHLHYIYHK